MRLSSILGISWDELSDKLLKDFLFRARHFVSSLILTLTNSHGDNLVDLNIGGNSEQVSQYNVRSVSGTAVRVDDSYAGNIKNIVQYGQCIQNGIPTSEEPVAITGKVAGTTVYSKNLFDKANVQFLESTTITQNEDGFTLAGKWYVAFNVSLSPGTYYLSGTRDNNLGVPLNLYSFYADHGAVASVSVLNTSVTLTQPVTRFMVYVGSGTDASADFHNMQLESGSSATAYEPYVAQTQQTVTDSNGDPVTLYGIPVTSGGNVVIDGQQYIADTLDGNVLTRRVGKMVFDGTEEWHQYSSQAEYLFYLRIPLLSAKGSTRSVCSHYPWTAGTLTARIDEQRLELISGTASRFYISSEDYVNVDNFKAYLAAQYAAGTPVTVYYVLTAPTTETVTISPASLQTNSPTTTWLSDAYSTFELPVTGQGNVTLPNPSWPVPIENVGTLMTEGEHVGKYAIPVKVSGKNLFDISAVPTVGNNLINNGDGTLTVNKYATPTGKQLRQLLPSVRAGDSVMFRQVTTADPYYNIFYTSDGTIWQSGVTKRVTADMLDGIVYLYCQQTDGVSLSSTISNIQLELGSVATEYEPYHEPVNTTIYLDEPLRKGDTLEVVGGTLVKRRAAIQSYNGETVGDSWISTTGELTMGATVEYELETPVTINLAGQTIPTFEGTTIITVDTDPEPETMTATYWQEG